MQLLCSAAVMPSPPLPASAPHVASLKSSSNSHVPRRQDGSGRAASVSLLSIATTSNCPCFFSPGDKRHLLFLFLFFFARVSFVTNTPSYPTTLCSLGCVFHVEYKHLITPPPPPLQTQRERSQSLLHHHLVCLDGCKEEKGSSCRRSYKTKQIQQSRSFKASHQGHSSGITKSLKWARVTDGLDLLDALGVLLMQMLDKPGQQD